MLKYVLFFLRINGYKNLASITTAIILFIKFELKQEVAVILLTLTYACVRIYVIFTIFYLKISIE